MTNKTENTKMKYLCAKVTAFVAVILTILVSQGCTASNNEASISSFEKDTTIVEDTYVETRSIHNMDKRAAIVAIKQFEGYRDTVYKCSNGVPTIGWGTTKCCLDELYKRGYIKDTLYYVWGDTITKAKADFILSKTIDMIHASARKYIPDIKYLSPCAQAALMSWAYQCGIGSVNKKTGILGTFPELAEHVDDKMLYDILADRAFYGKYKSRRFREAALVIGLK